MAAKEKLSAPKGMAKAAAPKPQATKDASTPEGERIAKVLSRRGVASRREAERMIEIGEVTVNGKVITSPALNVTPRDRITISGHPLPPEEPARLWLYYKPEGLVTSEADEKGRETVFANLPEDMPRVMSIGRLDLNSEGLLLLTNDGALKRKLELPSTGWLRKYRVRVNGNPTDVDLEPLRRGITVEGERFQPMIVTLDRIQGANAWITVGLREGKNREIRRALNAIDLYVNRLIRVSYGPFRLGDLQPGEVEEVRQKVMRDQLGPDGQTEVDDVKPARHTPVGRSGPKEYTNPRGKLPEGEGLRRLSDTYQKTLKPDASGTPRARPTLKRSTAKPYSNEAGRDERDATPSRTSGNPAGPSGAPAHRSAGKPAHSAPRKPATGPAKPSSPRPSAPRKPSGPKGLG